MKKPLRLLSTCLVLGGLYGVFWFSASFYLEHKVRGFLAQGGALSPGEEKHGPFPASLTFSRKAVTRSWTSFSVAFEEVQAHPSPWLQLKAKRLVFRATLPLLLRGASTFWGENLTLENTKPSADLRAAHLPHVQGQVSWGSQGLGLDAPTVTLLTSLSQDPTAPFHLKNLALSVHQTPQGGRVNLKSGVHVGTAVSQEFFTPLEGTLVVQLALYPWRMASTLGDGSAGQGGVQGLGPQQLKIEDLQLHLGKLSLQLQGNLSRQGTTPWEGELGIRVKGAQEFVERLRPRHVTDQRGEAWEMVAQFLLPHLKGELDLSCTVAGGYVRLKRFPFVRLPLWGP
jgi:hypothetical protein